MGFSTDWAQSVGPRPDYSEGLIEFYQWAIKPINPPPPFLPQGHTYETEAGGKFVYYFSFNVRWDLDDGFPCDDKRGGKSIELFGNLKDNEAVAGVLEQRGIIRGTDNTEHTDESELIVLFESQAAGLEFLARFNKYLKEKTQKLREAYAF